jgi:hypothetical protein
VKRETKRSSEFEDREDKRLISTAEDRIQWRSLVPMALNHIQML